MTGAVILLETSGDINLAVHLGAGRHIQTVNPKVFERIEVLFFCSEITMPLAAGLAKCSILAFYWRIFHVTSIRRPILIVGAAVVAWAIAFVSLDSPAIRAVVNNRIGRPSQPSSNAFRQTNSG